MNQKNFGTKIEQLVQKLDTYKDKELCIHLFCSTGVVRNSVKLNEYSFNESQVYLAGNGDDFVLKFDNDIEDIVFDDYEDSACIKMENNQKVYLDFI